MSILAYYINDFLESILSITQFSHPDSTYLKQEEEAPVGMYT